MCCLNKTDRGNRLSIQPKRPVVSTVFSPAMKRLLFLSCEACYGLQPCGMRPARGASGLVCVVGTNGNRCAIGRNNVWRDFEVVRRRHVFVYAASEVEVGAMAGAKKTAFPVGRQPRRRAGCQLRCGRTAQVSAYADCNEQFRIA